MSVLHVYQVETETYVWGVLPHTTKNNHRRVQLVFFPILTRMRASDIKDHIVVAKDSVSSV